MVSSVYRFLVLLLFFSLLYFLSVSVDLGRLRPKAATNLADCGFTRVTRQAPAGSSVDRADFLSLYRARTFSLPHSLARAHSFYQSHISL